MGAVALATAIQNGSPIKLVELYGLDHAENTQKLLTVLRELDAQGVESVIVLDGEEICRQYLHRRLKRWRQITYDVAMETDLECGDPSPEAQAWAAGNFEYPTGEDEV